MNIDKIKTIVSKTDGLAGWLLRRVETDATTVIRLPGIYTAEYGKFVRHDNPRPREVINAPGEEVWVTVWARHGKDGAEYLGEASGQFVSDEEAVVRATLASLLAAARTQPNKPYALADESMSYPEVELADPKLIDATRPELIERAQWFSDEVLKAAAAETGVDVSNLEIFIRRYRTRLETGAGIRVDFNTTRADAEVCFIARLDDKVAEHTARPHARRFEDLDPKRLVATSAAIARGIAQAGPPPQYEGPVVVAGEAAHDFMGLGSQPLAFHCSARSVYEKMSRYKKDESVNGELPVTGDAVTVFSDPLVPFGPNSQIVTQGDATPVRRVALLRNGRYDELLGGLRYYDYLGLPAQGVKPSGAPGNTVVPAGKTKTADLLDAGKVVVVRAFSDFRADDASGDFASEIRLGEIRENGKVTLFKGGLLIGNWFTALTDIRLSAETTALDGYYGPAAIRVGSLQVAG